MLVPISPILPPTTKMPGQTNKVPITLTSVDGTSHQLRRQPGCDDTEQTLDMTQAIGMAPGLAGLTMYIGFVNADDPGILNGMATATPAERPAELPRGYGRPPIPPRRSLSSNSSPCRVRTTSKRPAIRQSGASGLAGRLTSLHNLCRRHRSDHHRPRWRLGHGNRLGGQRRWYLPEQLRHSRGRWLRPPAAKCSQTLRNGPDVSANSNFTFYVCADQTTCTANCTAEPASPLPCGPATWLSPISRPWRTDGTPLGFINPALYASWVRAIDRLPRHHQRQQRLLGDHRLRSRDRRGKPERTGLG